MPWPALHQLAKRTVQAMPLVGTLLAVACSGGGGTFLQYRRTRKSYPNSTQRSAGSKQRSSNHTANTGTSATDQYPAGANQANLYSCARRGCANSIDPQSEAQTTAVYFDRKYANGRQRHTYWSKLTFIYKRQHALYE